MERIADFVLRHRRAVMVFWLLAFIVGVLTAAKTVDRLTTDFSIPGQPGFKTSKAINQQLGQPTDNGPSLPVLTAPAGKTVDDPAIKAQVAAFWNQVRVDHPGWRIADWTTTNDQHFVTKDRRSTYAIVYGPIAKSFSVKPFGLQIVDQYASAQAAKPEAPTITATGYLELSVSDAQTSGKSSGGPGLVAEVIFGAGGALIILAFVFASFLAFLPLVIAAVSVLTTFAVLLPFTYITHMNAVLQFLLIFIGLGVAIDYSLLLVTRWREERDHGSDNATAVRTAVAQAGHSVVFSGAAVAIGLLSLTVLNVPFLRSLGLGGMFIPLISTLVTITLTPAILVTIGPRVDWPRIRKEATASRAWSRWTRGVVRRPKLALGAALVLLALMTAPMAGIKLGNADTKSLTTHRSPITDSFATLTSGGVPSGILTPLEVLTNGDPAAVTAAVGKVNGVAFSFVGTSAERFAKGSATVVEVVPTKETVNSDSTGVVGRLRSAVKPVPGVVGVAGAGPVLEDYFDGIYKKVPLVLGVLAVLTFLALTRAFRSVVLAIKAVILNLISLVATFGIMTFIWQEGHGSKSIFNVESTGSITFWVPILIFAFLYGLSMDYEVFILTRVREEYDRGGDTNAALIEGLGRTGRLVTSAALILFLSFVSLSTQPGTDIKVLATGLGVGILLDATVVRALLVPALIVLFGKWNWYLPDGLARVLRIRPSHAIERSVTPHTASV